MRAQKNIRTMKKGVNKIEHQEEIWYKMVQNCQMAEFSEKLGQLSVQLSLEPNGIETNLLIL